MILFPSDYFSARQRFREVAARLGWELESREVAARGPKGEVLTIEVARSSPASSENTLIISSGLHGVEGFFGSAVQLGMMERWAENSGEIASLKVVLLHALNPFGFAWLRRTNEENVDLNRNFLLPGEPYSGSSAGYASVNGLLNPPRPPVLWDAFFSRVLWAILKHGGVSKLRQAVAGGQYDYPKGLFYGGSGPSQTQQILAENLRRWIGPSRRVMHLDFHTGLGKWAQGKLLLDQTLSEDQQRSLDETFGAERWEKSHRRGIAYQTRGGLGNWCAHLLKDVDYLGACAEFGTFGNITMCGRMRAENQAHHWGKPEDAACVRAKRRFVEAFCPSDEGWRRTVIQESFRLVECAVRSLSR
jgi:hypothetical protein